MAILSSQFPVGEPFKILGLQFDTKLNMRGCVDSCVVEAGWRLKTLMRTHRFFTDVELLGLFKAHILSFIEYRTPGIYHACSSILAPVDRVLSGFLARIDMSESEALIRHNLAPLSCRRDIAMLGVTHRAVLGMGPLQFHQWFKLDSTDLRRSSRAARHDKQIEWNFGGKGLGQFKRPAFGLCKIYNLLPLDIVAQKSVKAFQSELQGLLKSAAELDTHHWRVLFPPRLDTANHPFMNT